MKINFVGYYCVGWDMFDFVDGFIIVSFKIFDDF